MANLLSELERFEQEMRELGSESAVSSHAQSSHQGPRMPLPPPPPLPSLSGPSTMPGGAIPLGQRHIVAPPPPPPPPGARPGGGASQPGFFPVRPPHPPPGAPTPPSSSPHVPRPPSTFPPPPPPRPPAQAPMPPLPGARPPAPPPNISQPPRVSPAPAPPPPQSQYTTTSAPQTYNQSTPSSWTRPPSAPAPPFRPSPPQSHPQPPTQPYPQPSAQTQPGPKYQPYPPTSAPPSSRTAAPPAAPYFPVPFHVQQQQQQQQQQGGYSQQQVYQSGSSSAQQTYEAGYMAGYQAHAAPVVMPPTLPVPGVSFPTVAPPPSQIQQAQSLFEKDKEKITPEEIEKVKKALASSDAEVRKDAVKRPVPRKAAGVAWEDPTLADWPENDHRLFCGDLGNEVNDEVLTKAFQKYPSFNMGRVVRDKRSGKTKGFGFVSFSDPIDLAQALREMNGKYVGNRPIKLRKSTWQERIDSDALERQKANKRPKVANKKHNILHK